MNTLQVIEGKKRDEYFDKWQMEKQRANDLAIRLHLKDKHIYEWARKHGLAQDRELEEIINM